MTEENKDLLMKLLQQHKALGIEAIYKAPIPTIQKKLRENGSPKAIIETDESRSYFLIDIPCRKDFVQDKENVKQHDIQYVVTQILSVCPRYVQDMSKM